MACLSSCGNSTLTNHNAEDNTADTAQAAADAAVAAADAAAAAADAAVSSPAPVEPEAHKSSWSYSHDEDQMGTGTTHFASVSSTNTVIFDFPYDDPQSGQLLLRTHPRHGKDVLLSIEKGQFNCSYDGCSVMVRFDDKPAQRYSAAEPADNDTTTLFIQNYKKFYASVKESKRVRIEAEFFQEGLRTFDFDISGFDDSQYIGSAHSAGER